MPVPVTFEVDIPDTSPPTDCCCNCTCTFSALGSCICRHLNHYWQAYMVVMFWLMVLALLSLFNDEILDPLFNFLEGLGVDKTNWVHVLLYCSLTPLIFSPHPIIIVTPYYTIMGFYFGYPAFIYAFFTLIIAVLQTWLFARYCCCDKRMVKRWFPTYVNEFEAFSLAFSEHPKKLGFLISFAPFQSQYNILLPPALADMKFTQWFFPVLCGQMTVETFDLMIGIQAKTLSETLDPNGKTTEDLIIRLFLYSMGIICMLTLLWYFSKLLNEYTNNVSRELRTDSVVGNGNWDLQIQDISTIQESEPNTSPHVPGFGRQVTGQLVAHIPHNRRIRL